MSKALHVLAHVGVGALTVLATYSDRIPGKFKPIGVAVGSLAQLILGYINHKP